MKSGRLSLICAAGMVPVPLLVRRLRHAGYRIVTTVHEPYVPFDMWRRLPMGIVQRLELWLLVMSSAKIAVTISTWTRMRRTVPEGID